MNIKFTNLTYKVPENIFQKKQKTILKSINGEFYESELTAIIGPSGGGKTSLLNILSGFVTQNISGKLTLNGSLRDLKTLQKNSAYIMQEQNLFPLLTISETMNFAIKFKTGNKLSKTEQIEKIEETLKMLSLYNCDTYVRDLSGGQKKRLSIALEILHDPKIIFLDEPITGLDSSSSTQCLTHLKDMAKNGNRTIIITIHQPTAKIFEMFDHIYALANGRCIYQGSSKNLVPCLKEINLICPNFYNPCDYLLEISSWEGEIGAEVERKLTNLVENGKSDKFRNINQQTRRTNFYCIDERESTYSLSMIQQLKLLLLRNFMFMIRDKTYMRMRVLVSIFMGLLIGCLYYQVGQEASYMISSYKYLYCSMYFLSYSAYFSLMTRFPLDFPIIKREHFNLHYSSFIYYLAFNLADAPLLLLNSVIYTLISHTLTGIPFEWHRILTLLFVAVGLSFSSQTVGIFCGSMNNIKITIIIAMPIMVWHVIFAGAFVIPKDTPIFMSWMFEVDFLKHAADAMLTSIFGWNREKLPCNEMYCHFQWPKDLLKYVGLSENVIRSVAFMTVIFAGFHIITYYNMRRWLKS